MKKMLITFFLLLAALACAAEKPTPAGELYKQITAGKAYKKVLTEGVVAGVTIDKDDVVCVGLVVDDTGLEGLYFFFERGEDNAARMLNKGDKVIIEAQSKGKAFGFPIFAESKLK